MIQNGALSLFVCKIYCHAGLFQAVQWMSLEEAVTGKMLETSLPRSDHGRKWLLVCLRAGFGLPNSNSKQSLHAGDLSQKSNTGIMSSSHIVTRDQIRDMHHSRYSCIWVSRRHHCPRAAKYIHIIDKSGWKSAQAWRRQPISKLASSLQGLEKVNGVRMQDKSPFAPKAHGRVAAVQRPNLKITRTSFLLETGEARKIINTLAFFFQPPGKTQAPYSCSNYVSQGLLSKRITGRLLPFAYRVLQARTVQPLNPPSK